MMRESNSNKSENKSGNEIDKVYSDHIFMMPLKIDENFKLSEKWKEDFIDDEIDSYKNSDKIIGKKLKHNYMLMRYFNDYAKKIILNTKDSQEKIIENYHFKPLRELQREKGENGIYRITLEKNNNEDINIYDLELTDVRLRKYKDIDENGSLYLLIIYTQNRKYNDLKDIKRINQFGRRIFSPWIPNIFYNDENIAENLNQLNNCNLTVDYTECAKSISIVIDDIILGENSELNYFDFWKNKYINREISSEELEDIKNNVCNFIISKEEYNFELKKFIKEPRTTTIINELIYFGNNNVNKKIELLQDDRMFVCYLIRNDELIKKIGNFDNNLFKYSYEYFDEVSDELYSIVYIDNGEASCKSRTMREELLKKAIYSRWIDSGTIHAVTQHSFGCITTQGAPLEAVIEPFLIEYIEMVSIVLNQRYQLLRFSQIAGEECEKFDDESLKKIQKKYIFFKNKFLLFEVTPQEQGYELYKKLQEELYVFEEKKELDDQLRILYEHVNVEQEQKLNEFANDIGGLALFLAFISFIWDRTEPFIGNPKLFSKSPALYYIAEFFYNINECIFFFLILIISFLFCKMFIFKKRNL